MAHAVTAAPNGVVLPPGHTASTFFHQVLRKAREQFPNELADARLPDDPKLFKRTYGAALASFEAVRAASPQRAEIARFIVRSSQAELEYGENGQRKPLADYFAQPLTAAEPVLEQQVIGDAPVLRVEIPFEGKLYRGGEAHTLLTQLAAQHDMTSAAATALRWMVDRAAQAGGVIDLRGQRFVLLGAAAELAPTRMLLAAGASVLWVDLADPSKVLFNTVDLSGQLFRAQGASNLLEAPREIGRAIARFAAEGPVHIGMFAYASGASQEWRLGAAMTALLAHLDPALVISASLLVSPTTAAVLEPECVLQAQVRWTQRSLWKKALAATGALRAPGSHRAAGVNVGLSTVSIQGLSYQAAQYISKLTAAETFATHGIDLLGEHKRPITVSANVAGITRTRSLSHPLFQAAFIGAPRFGVRIFDPGTTRALSGYLMLHDLLNPQAPSAAAFQPADARDKINQLFSRKIHGGIYALPFELESAIRVAALIGMSRKPSLLLQR